MAARLAYETCVSIHARHYWRARPSWAFIRPILAEFQSTPAITGGRDQPMPGSGSTRSSFNPRPPLLAGETGNHGGPRCADPVSIHARHYWRARPLARCN